MIWGLVGASNIAGQYMIAAIRAQAGGSAKWVVSGSNARAQDFAGKYGIEASTTDIDTMLSDPEVESVYISSTNEKHYDQACRAIAAGKKVLCEKPLAMSLDDAVDMVGRASEAGTLFATNHHLRNAGSHLAIRELIASGAIGSVQSVRVFHAVPLPEKLQAWRVNDPVAGGGVVLDIVVHDADTIRFHLAEDPVEVVALTRSAGLGQGVEDSVMSAWSMESGAQVQVHASFTHRYAETGIEIYGSKGSIRGRGVMTQRPVGAIELMTDDGSKSIDFDIHDLYTRAVSLFDAAARGEGDPAASGIDGVKSLAVALAVLQAADRGNRVVVDYGGL
ncbi:MAG: Gfo/Idh/MocA family oxidoreductase [Hyphomicrobiales bacterium]|nr:Gfo/Idh/MocA family oxidoreductase [Hyphomicrobiales bacterium]